MPDPDRSEQYPTHDEARVPRLGHGVRSGVMIGGGTLVFSAAAYLFQTACIRFLGPSRFSDIAALLALSMVIAVPMGSMQTLVAREAAYLQAASHPAALRRFFRHAMALAIPGAAGLTLVALLATRPIERLLGIESAHVVIAGMSALGFMVVTAILYAFLQGMQRFTQLAANYAISGIAKPVLVVPALIMGFGSAGALTVNVAAGGVAVVLAAWSLRDLWRGNPDPGPHVVATIRVAAHEVTVLVIGSLAFASLTNLDVVMARYFLDGHLAGIYAAAALVGKLVLLLPAAVVTVLLPKAASRAAAGDTSHHILLRSAGATAVMTAGAALLLALTPEGLLVWAFGPDFRESTGLLGWFGVTMALAALINVYLSVYIAHRDLWFPLLVTAAAVAQVVLVTLWHPGPRAIVMSTLAVCTMVVVVHELFFPHRLIRILRGQPGSPPAPVAP